MTKFIRMNTPVPGPVASELLKRRLQAVPRAPYQTILSFVKEAHGALVTDVDGNTMIDFAGAIGTLNVGHTPAGLVQAVQEQLSQYIHTCFHVVMYEPYVRLAEVLNQLTPGDFAKKTLLFNSGAEAVENAVKVAKRYTGRRGVISFERGFHGRTYMALSLTSKNKPYKTGLGPFVPDTYQWPYPDYYHGGRLSVEEMDRHLLHLIGESFLTRIPVHDIACVIMEPQQGEGGFIVPSANFVQSIRELCTRHGILLISDEIQSGFGRTGKWFAIEHHGVVPDMITMSKSIAGGLPVSALTGKAEIMDAPDVGEIGGTYGGSPLACVAALEVISQIQREGLLQRADELGNYARGRMTAWKERFPFIGDVRGLGSMLAMEIVSDPVSRKPDAARTQKIVQYAHAHGLIVLTSGVYGNVIRLLYPLVITDEQIAEGMDVLEAAVTASGEDLS